MNRQVERFYLEQRFCATQVPSDVATAVNSAQRLMGAGMAKSHAMALSFSTYGLRGSDRDLAAHLIGERSAQQVALRRTGSF